MSNNKKNLKYHFFSGFYFMALIYLIFFTINWSIPYFDILNEYIRAQNKGYKYDISFSTSITIQKLWVYIFLRILLVLSSVYVLFKRNVYSILIFIILFTPILFDGIKFFVENFEMYISLAKGLGNSKVVTLVYKEVIYLMAIILIFIFSIIHIRNQKLAIQFSFKTVLMWVFFLILSFVLYFKFNLKF